MLKALKLLLNLSIILLLSSCRYDLDSSLDQNDDRLPKNQRGEHSYESMSYEMAEHIATLASNSLNPLKYYNESNNHSTPAELNNILADLYLASKIRGAEITWKSALSYLSINPQKEKGKVTFPENSITKFILQAKATYTFINDFNQIDSASVFKDFHITIKPKLNNTAKERKKEAFQKIENTIASLSPLKYFNPKDNHTSNADTNDLKGDLLLHKSLNGTTITWSHTGGPVLEFSYLTEQAKIKFPKTGGSVHFNLTATVTSQFYTDSITLETVTDKKVFQLKINPEADDSSNPKKAEAKAKVDTDAANYKLFYFDNSAYNYFGEAVNYNDVIDHIRTPEKNTHDNSLEYSWTSSDNTILNPEYSRTYLKRNEIPQSPGSFKIVKLTLTVKKTYSTFPDRSSEAKKTFKLKVYAIGESPLEKRKREKARDQAREDLEEKIRDLTFSYARPSSGIVDLDDYLTTKKIELPTKLKLNSNTTLFITWTSEAQAFKIKQASYKDLTKIGYFQKSVAPNHPFNLEATFEVYFGSLYFKPTNEAPLLFEKKTYTLHPSGITDFSELVKEAARELNILFFDSRKPPKLNTDGELVVDKNLYLPKKALHETNIKWYYTPLDQTKDTKKKKDEDHLHMDEVIKLSSRNPKTFETPVLRAGHGTGDNIVELRAYIFRGSEVENKVFKILVPEFGHGQKQKKKSIDEDGISNNDIHKAVKAVVNDYLTGTGVAGSQNSSDADKWNVSNWIEIEKKIINSEACKNRHPGNKKRCYPRSKEQVDWLITHITSEGPKRLSHLSKNKLFNAREVIIMFYRTYINLYFKRHGYQSPNLEDTPTYKSYKQEETPKDDDSDNNTPKAISFKEIKELAITKFPDHCGIPSISKADWKRSAIMLYRETNGDLKKDVISFSGKYDIPNFPKSKPDIGKTYFYENIRKILETVGTGTEKIKIPLHGDYKSKPKAKQEKAREQTRRVFVCFYNALNGKISSQEKTDNAHTKLIELDWDIGKGNPSSNENSDEDDNSNNSSDGNSEPD